MNKKPFHKNLKYLLSWALYHLIVWTLLPFTCNTCLPLDSTEAVMWGSQWKWGYDKHPPLSAWAAELFVRLMGDAGNYFLSQLCIVLAGFGVYKLARLLKLTTTQALLSVLLLDTVYYYQYISPEFNVNYIQMPFWTWGFYFGINAVQNKTLRSWIGLGICIGLGALGKYLAIFILPPLFLAWLIRGELKTALKSPGLYLAGIIAFLLFLPHLIWMNNHEWITITYGLKRGGTEQVHWWNHLINPIKFTAIQLAMFAPAILAVLFSKSKTQGTPSKIPGLFALAWGACLSLVALSLLSGMELVTMWAAPMVMIGGIWFVSRFQLDQYPKPLFIAIISTSLIFTTSYGIVYGLGPILRDNPHRVNYPGKTLAKEVEQKWQTIKGNQHFDYLIADEFLGGIVNRYGQERPAVVIHGDFKLSTYLTQADVQKKGALILWKKSTDSHSLKQKSLEQKFPHLKQQFKHIRTLPDLIIPWPRRTDHRAGRYGLAIIPPKP